MANMRLNSLIKSRQMRMLGLVGGGIFVVFILIVTLLADVSPKKKKTVSNPSTDLTGILDESFTSANADSAMVAQQSELESLKTQMKQLALSMKSMSEAHAQETQALRVKLSQEIQEAKAATAGGGLTEEQKRFTNGSQASLSGNQAGLWHNVAPNQMLSHQRALARIHTVSFRKPRRTQERTHLNPAHYVPSNTSVRAVILGGADADASVNGQSKNNGVMLFKFLEDGTLPNGQHSRLRGCRVSGSAYGDISSERAFATLYKISCAHPGEPIIDKEVTGWVFFNGKVGVKGVPLMRDNKVMQWAGISGALSGIATAAQYAQSLQQFNAFGAASIVPSGNVAPYAAYGGASKAADVLSQYYVKRAEQYHPVIQVGSGNVVTIVFKDGFYLEPEESTSRATSHAERASTGLPQQTMVSDEFEGSNDAPHFNVPPEVLNQIDHVSNQPFAAAGVQP